MIVHQQPLHAWPHLGGSDPSVSLQPTVDHTALQISRSCTQQSACMVASEGQATPMFLRSLVLTTAGNVFGWGANDDGQLGSGTDAPLAQPSPVCLAAAQRDVCNMASQPAMSLRFTKACLQRASIFG